MKNDNKEIVMTKNNFSPEELEVLKNILDNGLPQSPCDSCANWWMCYESDRDVCTTLIKYQSEIHKYTNGVHWEYYDAADTIFHLNKQIDAFKADRDSLLSIFPLEVTQNDE